MREKLPNGTQVKVREFTGTVTGSYQCDDGTWHYDIDTGRGSADWADVPERVVEEIFTGIDACLYMDGESNIYIFYTSGNKFWEVIKDGLRSVNAQRYDYDELAKPVKRLVKEN